MLLLSNGVRIINIGAVTSVQVNGNCVEYTDASGTHGFLMCDSKEIAMRILKDIMISANLDRKSFSFNNEYMGTKPL
jgi:hypothetical protein